LPPPIDEHAAHAVGFARRELVECAPCDLRRPEVTGARFASTFRQAAGALPIAMWPQVF
jgi:hypothetical protein